MKFGGNRGGTYTTNKHQLYHVKAMRWGATPKTLEKVKEGVEIPRGWWDKWLGPTGQVVFNLLLKKKDKTNKVLETYTALAHELGCKPDNVKRIINRLCKVGALEPQKWICYVNPADQKKFLRPLLITVKYSFNSNLVCKTEVGYKIIKSNGYKTRVKSQAK